MLRDSQEREVARWNVLGHGWAVILAVAIEKGVKGDI